MRADLHIVVLSRAVAHLHGVGGLERYAHDLVTHLLRRGVRVTLLTRPPTSGNGTRPPGFDDERLSMQFVPYVTFPFAGRRGTTAIDRSTAYLLFGWRAGRLAASLVKRGGVHLVHGTGAASLGYARARQAEYVDTVPFVFNPQGMEEFGATGPGLGLAKQMAYAPLRRAVSTCARAADRVIATDRALAPVVRQHLKVDDARLRVVPNAIDVEALDRLTKPAAAREIRQRLNLSTSDALLLGVGRLEENKGFHHLIAALSRLAASADMKWTCVVLGDGPYRSRLQHDIASAGLTTRVQMPGRVSDADLHAWYEAATLFVHPTLYEGSSLVTLEAMAHRKPVVASAAGGVPDKVRPGVNGWLVSPGDREALARAIGNALADRDRLRAMGHEGRLIVEREFDWAVVARQHLELYEEVLTGRAPRASSSSAAR